MKRTITCKNFNISIPNIPLHPKIREDTSKVRICIYCGLKQNSTREIFNSHKSVCFRH